MKIEVDLRPELTEIRDQGARPTCLSQATTAAHERIRGVAVQLSPEYLHFFSAKGNPSLGASFPEVAQALKAEGQPIETDCPYFSDIPPQNWKPDTTLTVFRRATENKGSTFNDISQLIRARHTPVLGISLPIDFYNPSPPWKIPWSGPIRGLHAVLGVGIGSENGSEAILIRNSWGTEWADHGYAWLDEEFVSVHLKRLMILTDEVIS